DVELRYSDTAAKVQGPDMVVVETKTGNGRGVSDQALSDLGIRPVSMSKYCLGVAALIPELPANKWSRLMKRHDWARMPRCGVRFWWRVDNRPRGLFQSVRYLAYCVGTGRRRLPRWIRDRNHSPTLARAAVHETGLGRGVAKRFRLVRIRGPRDRLRRHRRSPPGAAGLASTRYG